MCVYVYMCVCVYRSLKIQPSQQFQKRIEIINLAMAEEFQAGICGDNWWNINNSSRSVFPLSSSPCSLAANYIDAVNFSTWQTDNLVDLKRSTMSSEALVSDNSLGFLDEHKTKQSESSASMGSTWTHHGYSVFGRASESKFHSVVEEAAGIDASNNSQVSTIDDALKPMNNQQFSLEHQSSDSYGYGNSKMMQSLYIHDPQPQPQPQADHSLFTNRSMAYSYNQVSPTWPKVSPFLKPSMPKQHLSGFHLSNNTTSSSSPSWNASALHDVPPDVFASSPNSQYPSQSFEHKPKNKREEAPDSAQVMNKRITVCESDRFKRPRIETPSPLPTFKVRKEKLGDRITALQQLVSPFGKTDTASVLHEAIEYIKYLHDQVSVLSTPYMKNGASIQQQQGCVMKESEEGKADLRRQGLCLVPISSTFPVANCEITAELWTPPVLMR